MTRNYKRLTHPLTLLAARRQGAADFAHGLSPSLNPYTQRNYRAAYAAGFDDALLAAAAATALEPLHEAPEPPQPTPDNTDE